MNIPPINNSQIFNIPNMSNRSQKIREEDIFYTKPTRITHGGSINIAEPAPISDKTFYTIFGKHDDLDVNNYPICDVEGVKDYAKRVVKSDNIVKYYIRAAKNGEPYNPIGINQGKSHSKKPNDIGDIYPYLEVNKKIFKNYVDFLRTKNTVYLDHVARDLLNKN